MSNEAVGAIGQTLPVSRGPHRIYAEMVPGSGPPVVLMHGFPDNTHLYDRLVPHLAGGRPIVRFDFLGWGRSDKPAGYPYTATNQVGDLAAAVAALDERLAPASWCWSRTTPPVRPPSTGRWPTPAGCTRWSCSTPTTTGSPRCAGR